MVTEKAQFPTYETLLAEAIANLAVDDGVVSSPAAAGSNVLNDSTKNWPVDIHRNRLVKIIRGTGGGQLRVVAGNSASALIITGAWTARLDTTSMYAILGEDLATILAGAFGDQFSPIEKAVEHNVAVVGGADILGAALVPTNTPCLFRVVAGFDVAGVLSVTITRGGDTQVQQFNHGVVLVPNCLFMFDHYVHAGDTVNYRYSVNATLMTLRVQEIVAGVQ